MIGWLECQRLGTDRERERESENIDRTWIAFHVTEHIFAQFYYKILEIQLRFCVLNTNQNGIENLSSIFKSVLKRVSSPLLR